MKHVLQAIPGVVPSIATDLLDLGIIKVEDLRDKNPQKLYDDLCLLRHQKIDQCMLYVFRCAVYFASHTKHDPEKLKWWNWKKCCDYEIAVMMKCFCPDGVVTAI